VKNRKDQFQALLAKARTLVSHLATNAVVISDFAHMEYAKSELLIPHGELKRQTEPNSQIKVAATAHIFYEDFVDEFLEFFKKTPQGFTWFITTPSQTIFDHIYKHSNLLGIRASLVLSPNRGRNFGPLLVEFSRELQLFDFVYHVHSKKSTHALKSVSNLWNKDMTMPMLNWRNVQRSIQILSQDKRIGLVYPDVSGFIRKINFRWGANLLPLRANPTLREFVDGQSEKQVIHFPPGGMFIVRTFPLIKLLSIKWAYEMFPEEKMQLDGTVQHGIERLIGHLITKAGLKQVVFKDSRWFVLREDKVE
jgi:lipopolysaccharide biosynthesis protein